MKRKLCATWETLVCFDTSANPTKIVLHKVDVIWRVVWVFNQRQLDFIGYSKSNRFQCATTCQNVKCDKTQNKKTVINIHHLFIEKNVIQWDNPSPTTLPSLRCSANFWINAQYINTSKFCDSLFSLSLIERDIF
jgi:hypothetical protein